MYSTLLNDLISEVWVYGKEKNISCIFGDKDKLIEAGCVIDDSGITTNFGKFKFIDDKKVKLLMNDGSEITKLEDVKCSH